MRKPHPSKPSGADSRPFAGPRPPPKPHPSPRRSPTPHLADSLAVRGLACAEQAEHVLGTLGHGVLHSEVVPQLLDAQLHGPQVWTPCGRGVPGGEVSLGPRSNHPSPSPALTSRQQAPATDRPLPRCITFFPSEGSRSGSHTSTQLQSLFFQTLSPTGTIPGTGLGCHTGAVVHTGTQQHRLKGQTCWQDPSSSPGTVTGTLCPLDSQKEAVTQAQGHMEAVWPYLLKSQM